MNKFLMLSVSVVLVMLVIFANQEAKAQTDAQFLNSLAADTRKTLPMTIGDVEFTDVTTFCQIGCQSNYATSVLGLTGWTPRLNKQNISIAQLEQSVKPQMLKDYCTSDAKQRNIGAALYVYDMYKAYIGVFTVNPSDCPAAAATPSATPSPSGKSVEDQYWDVVRKSSNAGDFQSYLNNYPNGQYSPIARLRINQLGGSVGSGSAPTLGSPGANTTSPATSASATVEQQYWDAVKNSSRPEDFQSYLRDYPNGQFVPIARLKISQLGGSAPLNPTNSTAEEQYWNNTKNSRQPQDFQGYLYNYPNGTYAALARLRISQLGGNPTQSSPVGATVEEQYWNNVKTSQRPQDFQDYLNTYPNGQYVLVARLRINQLTAVAQPNTVAAPQQQTVAQILASAEYGSLSEILPLRNVFVVASDLDSRDTILRELRALQKLVVVGKKEDADFFVIFDLTDQATGANVAPNTAGTNQTYLGQMLVFLALPAANGTAIPRILWRTKKTQFFDQTGFTLNRPPAVNATRELVKDLKKMNY